MDQRLLMFLDELYADGVEHDAAQPDRLLKRRNLEPDTAGLLSLIVRIAGARTVVEIGTSNGYSTIWLADAVGRYRSDLLPDIEEDWALPERQRLRELFLQALRQLMAHHRHARHFDRALPYAIRAIAAY